MPRRNRFHCTTGLAAEAAGGAPWAARASGAALLAAGRAAARAEQPRAAAASVVNARLTKELLFGWRAVARDGCAAQPGPTTTRRHTTIRSRYRQATFADRSGVWHPGGRAGGASTPRAGGPPGRAGRAERRVYAVRARRPGARDGRRTTTAARQTSTGTSARTSTQGCEEAIGRFSVARTWAVPLARQTSATTAAIVARAVTSSRRGVRHDGGACPRSTSTRSGEIPTTPPAGVAASASIAEASGPLAPSEAASAAASAVISASSA